MNFKLKLSVVMMMVFTSPTFSYEVNTHQAITRCAVTVIEGLQLNQCGQIGAVNLYSFVNDSLLEKEDYSEEVFEKYGDKYFDYAETGEGFTDWSISILNSSFAGLIEAGVILEDSVYHNADTFVGGGDGRFNNHFYAAQFDSKNVCKNIPKIGPILASNMLSNKALCHGYGKRTDNITWALDEGVNLGNGRVNDYGINDAFTYYHNSFTGKQSDRKKNQAKLFVSLGFMIHLIQDLHSPAHVRDGSHPLGDYLEIYGRYDGGYNLRMGAFNSNNNQDIVKAISTIDMKKVMLDDNKYSSYQDFFTHEANWVSKNFFSEAHNDTTKATNNKTGEGLDLDTSTDRDTIFDAYNTKLLEIETFEEAIAGADTALIGDLWNYIKTKGNVATEKGDIINNNVVAIIEKGYLFDSERMMAVVDGKGKPKGGYSYNDYDKTPLSDTAINVMPRAVVSSEAFVNYFFRGRMEASLDNDGKLTIKNTSDPQWVSSEDLLTFKKGMSIEVFYINDKDESVVLIPKTVFGNDINVGETYTIGGVGEALENTLDVGDEKKVIVLLDGQLGEKRGLDNYNLDARGLVVAYASSRVSNADILFSFDKSGSMGSDIENAKISAKSILDDVIGVDNDTTFVQVEAFSDGASVLLPYDNDITKVKAKIDTIYSGGYTALYDAIKLAGNNAVTHKINNNIPKSIVILYADGGENNSTTSKTSAIDAISQAKASEIDEVFLIFVGSGSGKAELQDIAARAGREFLSVENATALKDAIENILRGQ